MKKIILFAAVLLLFSGSVAMAKGYKGMTGDAELNVMLGDLNLHARGDTENFITELGASYGVPEGEISVLFSKHNMEPADVYMAVRLANMTGHPVGHIAGMHHSGQGWGAIAKNLGIKPGSADFHALKDTGKIKSFKGKGKGKKHKGHGKAKKHKTGKGKKGKGR